jgi:hypothetical protein
MPGECEQELLPSGEKQKKLESKIRLKTEHQVCMEEKNYTASCQNRQ